MSSTTTNLGLVKMASGETIGQWSDANNGSGANLDKIDTAIGTLNSQIAIKSSNLATNFNLRRFGNMVYCSCVGGTYNKDSSGHLTLDGTVIPIPSGYTPVFNCEMWDCLGSHRVTALTSGYFDLPDITTNTNLRFSGCWVTGDAMPT